MVRFTQSTSEAAEKQYQAEEDKKAYNAFKTAEGSKDGIDNEWRLVQLLQIFQRPKSSLT